MPLPVLVGLGERECVFSLECRASSVTVFTLFLTGVFNTTIALNASVLLVKAVPEPGPENSAFHLPAHHVTSPDTSRGETQHARLKSVQSQNAPSLF
eukprot:COSAG06_NODE_42422_length_381_cov_29.365248_1_plen_96_part_10